MRVESIGDRYDRRRVLGYHCTVCCSNTAWIVDSAVNVYLVPACSQCLSRRDFWVRTPTLPRSIPSLTKRS